MILVPHVIFFCILNIGHIRATDLQEHLAIKQATEKTIIIIPRTI